MITSVKPTNEQVHAIDLFKTGNSLKINAYAGTGKTATLVMLAQSTHRHGAYLAFNRSLAEEARTKFPASVICRTTHQLAYRETPDAFRQNRSKMLGSMNANYVAEHFRLVKLTINRSFCLSPRQRGALILETLRNFTHSADGAIAISHVPVWGKMKDLPLSDQEAISEDVVVYAQQLWRLMIELRDPTPLGHDGYFKLWTLSNPVISGEFIMVDESQDTNGAMLGVLKNQQGQMVYVGDRYQQIYEWRGAVNAMTGIVTEKTSTLTMSFRFGSAIADVATQILTILGETDRIAGNPQIESRLVCSKPKAILCRTNVGVIQHLLTAIESGIKAHVIGGNGELLRLLRAVKQLKQGLVVDVPEFFGFESWFDVAEFAETEEGAHLAMLVRLVQCFGEDHLIAVLSGMNQTEKRSELVISTVHRAKGRQWPRVQVHDDFNLMSRSAEGLNVSNEDELRLFYVAVTRAQFELSIQAEQAKLLGIWT